MINIKKQLVSKDIADKVTYTGTNTKKYIVIHETANTNKGANAQAHANLQSRGNSRSASWHYQVDDKQVIQSFDDNKQCWHAGNASYNKESIGIEICVNSDGNYLKAVDNAIQLTKYLMDKYNISADNVIQHNVASGKDCPRYLRSGNKGITWNEFKNRLVAKKQPTSVTNKPVATSKSNSNSKSSIKPNYSTNSVVEFLASIKQPFSFDYRKRLASVYGIKNYQGKAVQNLMLLDKLKRDYKATGKIKTTSNTNTSTSSKTSTKTNTSVSQTFKVGSKVKIKSSAKRYSRANVAIPARYKNKTYTVQQVGKNDVLIKELNSWVKKSDLQ